MAVRKLKGSWWVDFQYRGERTRKRSPVNTRAGALAYELDLKQEILRPTAHPAPARAPAPPPSTPTLQEFAARWLKDYAAVNNRPSEQHHKESALRNHLLPFLGARSLADIRTADVEALKAGLIAKGLSAKSINNYLVTLQTCLRVAQEWEVIDAVPRVRMLPRTPPPFRHLSKDDIQGLINAAPCALSADMIAVAAGTGLRFGELIALEWSDVNFEDNLLVVQRNEVLGVTQTPKSHRIRHVPLSDEVRAVLLSRPRSHARIFTRGSERIRQGWALSQLTLACEVAGVPRIGWHVLRHSFASELARRGAPILAIKDLLGHSTVEMTMRYAHLSVGSLHEAIALLGKPSSPPCQPGVNRNENKARTEVLAPSPWN